MTNILQIVTTALLGLRDEYNAIQGNLYCFVAPHFIKQANKPVAWSLPQEVNSMCFCQNLCSLHYSLSYINLLYNESMERTCNKLQKITLCLHIILCWFCATFTQVSVLSNCIQLNCYQLSIFRSPENFR